MSFDIGGRKVLLKRLLCSGDCLTRRFQTEHTTRHYLLKQSSLSGVMKRRHKHTEPSKNVVYNGLQSVIEKLSDRAKQSVRGTVNRFSVVESQEKLLYAVSPAESKEPPHHDVEFPAVYLSKKEVNSGIVDAKSKPNKQEGTPVETQNVADDNSQETPAESNNKNTADQTNTESALSSQDVDNLNREQHDLASALASKYESVQTYYKPSTPIDFHLHGVDERMNISSVKRELETIVKEAQATDEAVQLADSRAQRLLKSAGATVAGSQEYISGVVKRIPLSNILPSRKATPPAANITSQGTSNDSEKKKKPAVKRPAPRTRRVAHEKRTRELTLAVIRATGNSSKMTRLEDLCAQLAEYPETRGMALQVQHCYHIQSFRR